MTPEAGLEATTLGLTLPCRITAVVHRGPSLSGVPPRAGPSDQLSPQRTAFFTSAAIFFSSAAVNFVSAKEVGHMAPSSRFAASSKPNVAYLELNFPALLKKQTTLPSLAYAGIPYQVFGQRSGALASMIAWSRLAMARSGSFIAAIAASRSRSPSSLFLLARASAFRSWARAFIAARSSAVNPLDVLVRAVALFADFCVTFVAGFFSAIAKHPFRTAQPSSWMRIRLPPGSRKAQSRIPYG